MAGEPLSFILLSISSILIIINPLGATLFFVSLTEGMDYNTRKSVAKDACRLALLILLVFALAGNWILNLFGITLEAFRIAGGVLLFGIGMEMVNAKISRTKYTATEKYESIDAEAISVIPLAIPIIAGPGSIATAIVLTHDGLQLNLLSILVVVISIALTILLTYLLLLNSDAIMKRIGQRHYRVMNRLMGILLIAIAVQFIINGIQASFPLLAGG